MGSGVGAGTLPAKSFCSNCTCGRLFPEHSHESPGSSAAVPHGRRAERCCRRRHPPTGRCPNSRRTCRRPARTRRSSARSNAPSAPPRRWPPRGRWRGPPFTDSQLAAEDAAPPKAPTSTPSGWIRTEYAALDHSVRTPGGRHPAAAAAQPGRRHLQSGHRVAAGPHVPERLAGTRAHQDAHRRRSALSPRGAPAAPPRARPGSHAVRQARGDADAGPGGGEGRHGRGGAGGGVIAQAGSCRRVRQVHAGGRRRRGGRADVRRRRVEGRLAVAQRRVECRAGHVPGGDAGGGGARAIGAAAGDRDRAGGRRHAYAQQRGSRRGAGRGRARGRRAGGLGARRRAVAGGAPAGVRRRAGCSRSHTRAHGGAGTGRAASGAGQEQGERRGRHRARAGSRGQLPRAAARPAARPRPTSSSRRHRTLT